jgi:hypothetical protein
MAQQISKEEFEKIAVGGEFEFWGRPAKVVRVEPIRKIVGRAPFRWIEIESGTGNGSIGFIIEQAA